MRCGIHEKVTDAVGRPFTSKIYSSAEAKKRSGVKASSTETTNKAQSTIDNSSAKSTAIPASQPSTGSYARAAAQPATGKSGLESTDPKPLPALADLGLGAPIASAGAPRAVRTRSRAGRVVDDD